MESRYKFIRHGKSAFVIEGKDRQNVIVRLSSNRWIEVESECEYHNRCLKNSCDPLDKFERMKTFKLHAFRKLIGTVVELLWANCKLNYPKGNGSPPAKLRMWAREKTGKAICGRFKAEWENLLSQVEPQILELDKRLFHCTFKYSPSPLMSLGALTERPYLISDILKYRAAACVFDQPSIFFEAGWDNNIYNSIDQFDFLCADWKRIFAPQLQTYTSLNRTLMNLPGGIPVFALGAFQKIRLERPITDRLELMFLLGAVTTGCNYQFDRPNHYHVFQHATRKQLKTVIKRIGEHTRNRYSTRKTQDIWSVLAFLTDYPERHTGNVVGLAKKSIQWHRETRRNRFLHYRKQLDPTTEVAKPPIKLPQDERIKFLATVKDIFDEAENMDHCIDSYASNAVRGDCFLFHVEYKDEHASIEVDSTGKVRQAQGPWNRENGAASWGRSRLSRWARRLPSDSINPCEEIPLHPVQAAQLIR